MNIVLDTCIFIRNDPRQKKVNGFNYEELEKLLNDENNKVFVSGFSLPEIFFLKKMKSTDDLVVALAKQNALVVPCDFSKLSADFAKYDLINKFSAVMFYSLTEFLQFFVLEIAHSVIKDDIESLYKVVCEFTRLFYKENGNTTLENSNDFMKIRAVDYIVKTVQEVLCHYGKKYADNDVWKIIGDSHFGSALSLNVCECYMRYGRFLKNYFREKYKNKAKTIKLHFGFVDLLISQNTENGYIVVTTDKEMSRYLLKYGNDTNKLVLNKLWGNALKPAEY